MSMQEAVERINECLKHKAKKLNLSGLGLNDLPIEINQLSHLEVLELHYNSLKELPPVLINLTGLKELYLQTNLLDTLPEWISSFSELQILDLTLNMITNIPQTIFALKNLRVLSLRDNKVSFLPKGIGELSKLEYLNFGDNMLEELPDDLRGLKNLENLTIWGNKFEQFPKAIFELFNLKRINLSQNFIGVIPKDINKLSNLKILDLSFNKITSLPLEITSLTNLREIHLGGNSNLNMPFEIANSTYNPQLIFDHLLAKYSGNTIPLTEVKVILIGEADVGKSTLVQRLIDNNYEDKRSVTSGIIIRDWVIPVGDHELTLHLWDFGGQDVMHNTHRFFLSTRCLYLLVVDNSRNSEANRIEEWLKTIRTYAEDAPILVVINKDELKTSPLSLAIQELQRTYDISGFHRISSATGEGRDALKNSIINVLLRMPHLNEPVPFQWMIIRQKIAMKNIPYLDYREFQNLCEFQGVGEYSQSIAEFLHLLGVALHYSTRHVTKYTHILNPNWVTDGIYPIITNELLKRRGTGIIDDQDIANILDVSLYPPDKHGFILGMMFSFEIAFELGDGRYLVPDLLPKTEPRYDWNTQGDVRFVYQYDHLPDGIFTRLLVRLQHQIVPQNVWLGGAILYHRGQPYARILVRPSLNRIEIAIQSNNIRGVEARTLLDTLRDTFDALHKVALTDMKKVQEFIPHSKGLILYDALLDFEREGLIGNQFYPPYGFIDVSELLNGIASPSMRKGREQRRIEVEQESQKSHEDIKNKRFNVAAFFANPLESEQLVDLQLEERQVRERLNRQHNFNLVTVTGTRLQDLLDLLDRPAPRLEIFHYSGHASDQGIWLESDHNGSPDIITWASLARELRHQQKLRCIVLNGCKSYNTAFSKELGEHHPYIIAMSAPIGDKKATVFAMRFYETLAAGDTFEMAFDKACNALRFKGYNEDGDIPKLLPTKF